MDLIAKVASEDSSVTCTRPVVSVIIVNHNGRKMLSECLDRVAATDYPDFEIIVVDNGSTDGSQEFLRSFTEQTLRMKTILNARNVGPAAARNQGAKIAEGSLLAFLDNDTKPDRRWLACAVDAFNDCRVGAIQCKLLLDDDSKRFDSIGSYVSALGFLVHRVPLGVIVDSGQYEVACPIFSTKSAAMVMRRMVFETIGGFDESYFIYNEEMDLCWRVWLSGHSVAYVPGSTVYHRSGGTRYTAPNQIDFYRYFHGTKNSIATNVKCQQSMSCAFVHASIWFGLAMASILVGKVKQGVLILRGVLWGMRNLKHLLGKRTRARRLPPDVLRPFQLRYFLSVFRRY